MVPHTLVLEHVSPATRLLEKRRLMFEVQEALEQQKAEFNRKVPIAAPCYGCGIKYLNALLKIFFIAATSKINCFSSLLPFSRAFSRCEILGVGYPFH